VNTFDQHVCTDYCAKITILYDGGIIAYPLEAGGIPERESPGQMFNQAEFTERIYVCTLHGAKLAQKVPVRV
jgi:hypothetical protein